MMDVPPTFLFALPHRNSLAELFSFIPRSFHAAENRKIRRRTGTGVLGAPKTHSVRPFSRSRSQLDGLPLGCE